MDDRFERMDSRFERMDSRLAELNDKVGQLFVQFAEMRAETTEKLSAASIDSRDQFSNMLRWVVGVVIAGIGVNAAVMGIGLAVLALTAR